MKADDLMNPAKQLAHWTKRRDELHEWLLKSDTSHPNWEQNRRDLSTALLKIEQLNARDQKATVVHTHSYSLPNFKH